MFAGYVYIRLYASLKVKELQRSPNKRQPNTEKSNNSGAMLGFDAFTDEKDAIVGYGCILNAFTRIFFLLELLTLKH